jgi:hypothetical protein
MVDSEIAVDALTAVRDRRRALRDSHSRHRFATLVREQRQGDPFGRGRFGELPDDETGPDDGVIAALSAESRLSR